MTSYNNISVCALTQGENQPSTRFRWRQYVPYLESMGISTGERSAGLGSYPPVSKFMRPFWLIASSVNAMSNSLHSNKYSIRFLQREMVSTLKGGEYFLKKPFIFDVDDAIFLNQRFGAVDSIAKSARLIICGNKFLADYFKKFGPVEILPTAVDVLRFTPALNPVQGSQIIGWSGSSSGFKYLYEIESALKIVLDKVPESMIKIIADIPPSFRFISPQRIIFQKWHPATEVSGIQEFSVGIMPLTDGLWERGKCSFKLLTYMAVGIPVLASNVGMNVELLDRGGAGLLARNSNDWVEMLIYLLSQNAGTSDMGKFGRSIVLNEYSTSVVGGKLGAIITDCLSS